MYCNESNQFNFVFAHDIYKGLVVHATWRILTNLMNIMVLKKQKKSRVGYNSKLLQVCDYYTKLLPCYSINIFLQFATHESIS